MTGVPDKGSGFSQLHFIYFSLSLYSFPSLLSVFSAVVSVPIGRMPTEVKPRYVCRFSVPIEFEGHGE